MISLINWRSPARSSRSAAWRAKVRSRSFLACLLASCHFSYSLRAKVAPSVASFAFSTVRRYVDSLSSHDVMASLNSSVTLPIVMLAESSSPWSFLSSSSNLSMMRSFFLHSTEVPPSPSSAVEKESPLLFGPSASICVRMPCTCWSTSSRVEGLLCQASSLASMSLTDMVAPCFRNMSARWSSVCEGDIASRDAPRCCSVDMPTRATTAVHASIITAAATATRVARLRLGAPAAAATAS